MSASTQAVASLHSEVSRLRHELTTVKNAGSNGSVSTVAADTMFVGQYLVERIVQLGVTVCSPAHAFCICAHLFLRKCSAYPATSTSVSTNRIYPYVITHLDHTGFLVRSHCARHLLDLTRDMVHRTSLRTIRSLTGSETGMYLLPLPSFELLMLPIVQ